jgi:hypothetical protein
VGRQRGYIEKSVKGKLALDALVREGYRDYNLNLLVIHFTRETKWGQERPYDKRHLFKAAQLFYEGVNPDDVNWSEVLDDGNLQTPARPSHLGIDTPT